MICALFWALVLFGGVRWCSEMDITALFECDFEWGEGYYAVSVSQSQVEKVRNYIKNQEAHHAKKSFEEECHNFIKKYGFIRIIS
jgi:hypothetical protein